MNLIPDELKIQQFSCPSCGNVISSIVDQCPYCSVVFSEEEKDAAVRRELDSRRLERIKSQKNWMLTGAVFFLLGLFGFIWPFVQVHLGFTSVDFNCLSFLFFAGGIVGAAKGYSGYRQETRKF